MTKYTDHMIRASNLRANGNTVKARMHEVHAQENYAFGAPLKDILGQRFQLKRGKKQLSDAPVASNETATPGQRLDDYNDAEKHFQSQIDREKRKKADVIKRIEAIETKLLGCMKEVATLNGWKMPWIGWEAHDNKFYVLMPGKFREDVKSDSEEDFKIKRAKFLHELPLDLLVDEEKVAQSHLDTYWECVKNRDCTKVPMNRYHYNGIPSFEGVWTKHFSYLGMGLENKFDGKEEFYPWQPSRRFERAAR